MLLHFEHLPNATRLCRFFFYFFAAKKHGLDDVPSQVLSLISHATQERLRSVVEKLANIAEHRLEIYKVGAHLASCIRCSFSSSPRFLSSPSCINGHLAIDSDVNM